MRGERSGYQAPTPSPARCFAQTTACARSPLATVLVAPSRGREPEHSIMELSSLCSPWPLCSSCRRGGSLAFAVRDAGGDDADWFVGNLAAEVVEDWFEADEADFGDREFDPLHQIVFDPRAGILHLFVP